MSGNDIVIHLAVLLAEQRASHESEKARILSELQTAQCARYDAQAALETAQAEHAAEIKRSEAQIELRDEILEHLRTTVDYGDEFDSVSTPAAMLAWIRSTVYETRELLDKLT